MDKNIFEVITEYGINEAVNSTLLQNDEYKRIQDGIESLTDEFDGLNLSKEQCLIVDRLLSSYNESGALYGRMAYQQGFRDCALLLLEIGMIKDGNKGESA